MQKLYHFLEVFIDFLFPTEEIKYDIRVLKPNFDYLGKNITVLFSYQEETVKEIVWQIKYYKNEIVTIEIAKLFCEKIKILKLQKPFIIVPIPMSELGKSQRGYNQTEFMAEKILELLDQGICSGISLDLHKTHSSKPQHTLERDERIENAKHLFYVKEKNCFLGKNVLVIDDVVTTGSTLREAMRIAKENGAREVFGLAVAH